MNERKEQQLAADSLGLGKSIVSWELQVRTSI